MKALLKMYDEWENIQFNFVEYKDTGVSILSAVEDIQVNFHAIPFSTTISLEVTDSSVKCYVSL